MNLVENAREEIGGEICCKECETCESGESCVDAEKSGCVEKMINVLKYALTTLFALLLALISYIGIFLFAVMICFVILSLLWVIHYAMTGE